MDEDLILRQTGVELQNDLDKIERMLEIRGIGTSLTITNGILSVVDVLPPKINNRYLHTNTTTGALEWVEVGMPDVPLIFTEWAPEEPEE